VEVFGRVCGCKPYASLESFEVQEFALWAVHFFSCVCSDFVVVSFGDVFERSISSLVWEKD
jgi:hypothetical protein